MSAIEDVCIELIKLHKSIEDLKKPLEEQKDILRGLIDGETKEVSIDGYGKVLVSKPREKSEKEVLVLNEEKLNKSQELLKLLFSKDIIIKKTVVTSAAKASVTIKPNI